MTSVAGLQLDGLASSERLSELFPKCRPRDPREGDSRDVVRDAVRDVVNLGLRLPHAHDANTMDVNNRETERPDFRDEDAEDASGSGVDTTDEDSGDTSPSQGQRGESPVILLGKANSYKLRDSRIIEIAGGREVFCQSRSKAARKPRSHLNSRDDGDKTSASNSKNGKTTTPENRIWELRARCADSKRQRNSRDSNDPFTENRPTRHRNSNASLGGSVYESVPTSAPGLGMSGGEVVVFDDIGDDWRGVVSSSAATTPSPPGHHRAPAHYFKVSTSVSDVEVDSLSPDRDDTDENSKVARVIGSLPIAEYEGSPRRYGLRQTDSPHCSVANEQPTNVHPTLVSAHSLLGSPSMYTPRPGFPQRVVPERTSSPPTSTASTSNSTFDYLYEFSETRKVLEEFFKPSVESSSPEECGSHFQEQPEQEPENNLMELSTGSGSTEDLGDTEVGLQVGHSRNFTLSPETTDCDSNCGDLDSEVSLLLTDADPIAGIVGPGGPGDSTAVDTMRLYSSMPVLEDGLSSGHASDTDNNNPTRNNTYGIGRSQPSEPRIPRPGRAQVLTLKRQSGDRDSRTELEIGITPSSPSEQTPSSCVPDPELEALDPLTSSCHSILYRPEDEGYRPKSGMQCTPPPPAPAPHRSQSSQNDGQGEVVDAVIKDIRMALQRVKTLPVKPVEPPPAQPTASPIWVPRRRVCETDLRRNISGDEQIDDDEADTDLETDRLLGQLRTDDTGFYEPQSDKDSGKKKGRNKEDLLHNPSVLIEGVLFRARYLGSTQLVCEGQPTKSTRMMQAEEAVSRIKAPEGETQPSTEVDLFISTEKIMVLNTDLKEIMMDHALRTISYIADIGDLVVLMARRRFMPQEEETESKLSRTPKMICHVFQSEEAQFIAQSIGQAFQVAYMEFLKANGIEDNSFVKEMDYQEVLNSQEIFGDELQMFAKKEMQKEVVVPKAKGEILGVVIVESGWGSMLPTVVIANLAPAGAAARCGQLNIGDQIIAINGVSLVGLPLSTCQNYIKNTKTQTVVKLTVVPCAPVVEVKIKRPETKYQLGFSVQNGVICSLLRGGIAERGGVRVGHRIIEINNQSVVAVPHEKIVNLLATSVGEILMKTMPTSMFRLLTGQETPIYI